MTRPLSQDRRERQVLLKVARYDSNQRRTGPYDAATFDAHWDWDEVLHAPVDVVAESAAYAWTDGPRRR